MNGIMSEFQLVKLWFTSQIQISGKKEDS